MLIRDQQVQLQRWMAGSPVQQDGQGMAEELACQSRTEVPQVPRPGALTVKTLGQLPDDRLNDLPRLAEHRRPARRRIGTFLAKRSQQLKTLIPQEILSIGVPVVAV